MLLAHSCYSETCHVNEQTIFPQIASPHTCIKGIHFIPFIIQILDAFVLYELIHDSVFIKQYLKTDFQALTEEE